MGETPLFDYAAAKIAKDVGMAQVERNAAQGWAETMLCLVLEVAKSRRTFTSDDVFELAEQRGCAHGTHDTRAFGPVMMRAAKAGYCRKANCAPVNCRRPSRHASPLAVWQSLIFLATD